MCIACGAHLRSVVEARRLCPSMVACVVLHLAVCCLDFASHMTLLGRLPALKRRLQQLPSLSQNLCVPNACWAA